jgi:deoxyhypusine synthase
MQIPGSAVESLLAPVFTSLTGATITPSGLIRAIGLTLNDDDSFVCAAARVGVPIYSPGLSDGPLGDFLYRSRAEIRLDLVRDIVNMNSETISEKQTGVIVLGGGVMKHHMMNANLFRNGANWAVYCNTSDDFDGSDSGAATDEAVSWGKIALDGVMCKIFADPCLVLPILVGTVFNNFVTTG